ncbi:ligase-associated DNA damage response endonuclease PdeM [Pedobacter chitinilyticus]|uniref:Ligase-associated DNA damage response endonuclease PdeM n=1 Tax=Pedobacter chitinilyticus TaxID=2233776 RepID=A0A3S3PVJ0_9SPHI|nr:ligase-associated DNA damage response endonuclease PdeM [Pedobacter chitinilyticus]RWU10377.1 ligase-associated DNA damage response endonuclease PdeM [Pedobacter chitinilyticus]
MKISIREEEFILDKERAIYLPSEQLLAISDLHLGKAAHFRKAGLAVPNSVSQNDLSRLAGLMEKYFPKQLLINGDMFHSDYNAEIDEFARWKENFREINFILVKGNHDKQSEKVYKNLAIEVQEPNYQTDKFCFIHDLTHCNSNLYTISGHIHPGISIYNNAKQRLKFPCFYFGEHHAILPAFSNFTGLQLVKAKENDLVFAITPTKIVKV